MLRPKTNAEWAFFGATSVQAIVITALQLDVLIRYLNWVNYVVYQVPASYIVPISIAVYVAGCIYQACLTIDAFRIKNNIQLFAQCICNICLSIFSAMQYEQVKKAADGLVGGRASFPNMPFVKTEIQFWVQAKPLLIACVAVVFVCTIAMCFLAWRLHSEFAWALYKDISADTNTRSRYLSYQVYLVIIKLTFYFLFSFLIIYAFVNVHYEQPEFALTLALIPVSLLQVCLAAYYTRAEAKAGMAATIVIYLLGIAYLATRIHVLTHDVVRGASALRHEQMLFVVVAIVFLFAAAAAAVQCFLNFDKGLKPILLGQTQQRKGPAPSARDEENAYYFQRLNYAPSAVDLNRRFALD